MCNNAFGKSNVDSFSSVGYIVEGKVLRFVSLYRDLGVVIDS